MRMSSLGTMLLATMICVADRAAVAQMTGTDRDQFIMASVNTCTATADKTAQSLGAIASPTVTARYCVCLAYRSAAFVTNDDLLYMHQHGTLPEALKAKVLADIIPICRVEAASAANGGR